MMFRKSSVDTEEMEVLFIVIQMTIELLFPPFIFHSMPRNLVVLAISIMLMNEDFFSSATTGHLEMQLSVCKLVKALLRSVSGLVCKLS